MAFNIECNFMEYHNIAELGLTDGHNVVVADATTPKPLTLTLKFVDDME